MKRYNSILVVIEPKRDKQIALSRACEFAKYNPHVTITALRLVYDFSYDLHILNRNKEAKTREDVQFVHMQNLKEIVAPFESPDVHIETKIVFAKDIAQGIIQEVCKNHYDLIIKGANNHGILDSIIFTPIDWYVLRNSPIPVIIAKDHNWTDGSNIVVALDFTNSQKKTTNMTLLREAQLLATITKGEIHLVNSAPVLMPTVMLEVPNYAPEVYTESVVKEHKRRLEEFAKQHNIPLERCHIAEGMPYDVIPNLCKQINAKTVFIGSAGRQGVSAALVGNTCEEIVDYIDADLIVLNHKVLKKNE